MEVCDQDADCPTNRYSQRGYDCQGAEGLGRRVGLVLAGGYTVHRRPCHRTRGPGTSQYWRLPDESGCPPREAPLHIPALQTLHIHTHNKGTLFSTHKSSRKMEWGNRPDIEVHFQNVPGTANTVAEERDLVWRYGLCWT